MDIQNIITASVSIPPTSTPPSSPQQSDPTKRRSTCPFAALAPAHPTPPPGHPVVQLPQRRCPRWVRVLRFSAKFIAKQVIMRTVKRIAKDVIAGLRENGNNSTGKPCTKLIEDTPQNTE